MCHPLLSQLLQNEPEHFALCCKLAIGLPQFTSNWIFALPWEKPGSTISHHVLGGLPESFRGIIEFVSSTKWNEPPKERSVLHPLWVSHGCHELLSSICMSKGVSNDAGLHTCSCHSQDAPQ